MKFATVLIAAVLALPAVAQRRGGGFVGGGGGGFRGGGVGVGVRVGPGRIGVGTGFHGGYGYRRGPVVRPGWGGGYYRGNYYRGGFWPSYYGGWFGGYVVSGFSTPWYSSPYWSDYYDGAGYAPSYAPATVYVYGQPAAPAAPPLVIINEPPPPPAVRERVYVDRSTEELPPPTEAYKAPSYDIRFKNGKTATAVAFWIQDGMLHYVTPHDYARHSVALSQVDRTSH